MNSDIGLLGFLQKKSLLGNDTPRVQLRKRSNSRSKGDKDSIIKKINQRDFDERSPQQSSTPQRKKQQKSFSPKDQVYYQRQNTFQNFNPNQSRFAQQFNTNTYKNVQPLQNVQNKNIGSFSRTYDNYFEQQRNMPDPNLTISHNNAYNQQINSNQLQSITNRTFQLYHNNSLKDLPASGNNGPQQSEVFKNRQFQGVDSPLNRSIQKRFNSKIVEDQRGNNHIWGSKVIPQPVGFQSARLESAQCLDTLSLKLKTSISNINYQIDKFRSNIGYALNHHMRQLREKILEVVDQVFRESQKQIKQYMKYEEQRLAGQVLRLRNMLQDQYVRIEGMKEDLNRPQWRKVAGQILTTEIEKNIEILLKQSSEAQINRWDKINVTDLQINNLRSLIRDLTRFRK